RTSPRYVYEVDYHIGDHTVRFTNRSAKTQIIVDGKEVARAAFERDKAEYFPDLVFGYYSGGGRRLERIFDGHQQRYYDKIKLEDDVEEFREAHQARRLFYCRPIHGVFALMSAFAFPDRAISAVLESILGIRGFHSCLALFKEPWFAKGG